MRDGRLKYRVIHQETKRGLEDEQWNDKKFGRERERARILLAERSERYAHF